MEFNNYDPSDYIRRFPHDKEVQIALKAARELSENIAPLLPGESPLDAERRIDQAFHHLSVEIDKNLDSYHKGERDGKMEEFIAGKEREITNKYQIGITGTQRDELKVGGQEECYREIERMKQNINGNQDYKDMMYDLSNRQAARSEAILDAIKYTPPHGFSRETEPQKLAPNNDNTPDKKAVLPPVPRLPSETDQQYQARFERTLERIENEKQTPTIEIKPEGPTFGR